MKIHAYIIAWNEEKILPFTLDYYSTICEKIFVYDNMSTDSSDEIYKRYKNVEVIKWGDKEKGHNEFYNKEIKSKEYRKKSRGQNVDWVITVDCDEIIYHENLIDLLKKYKEEGVTLPRISGHDMFSEKFPIYDGDLITNKIKEGSDVYEPMSKHVVFNPEIDIEFGFGAHHFYCPECSMSKEPEIKLLHYKFIDFAYLLNRYRSLSQRQSDFNKTNQLSTHYKDDNAISYTNHLRKNKIKVI
jgi:DNA-directed RNA polymerase subunit H (RpoH/RPB5)